MGTLPNFSSEIGTEFPSPRPPPPSALCCVYMPYTTYSCIYTPNVKPGTKGTCMIKVPVPTKLTEYPIHFAFPARSGGLHSDSLQETHLPPSFQAILCRFEDKSEACMVYWKVLILLLALCILGEVCSCFHIPWISLFALAQALPLCSFDGGLI